MNESVTIEELSYDAEFERLFNQAYRNLMWFSEHAVELGVFKKFRGRYAASAGGELFVAGRREEVDRIARGTHPDEMPHIRYIPREKGHRIYG